MERVWIVCGGVSGAGAVAMAAVAAHGLGQLDPVALQQVRSAVQMQGWHALAVLAVACWATRGGWLAHLAGAAFALGSLLFCGAVYARALGGVRLPMMAPAGGLILIAGWLMLAVSGAWIRRSGRPEIMRHDRARGSGRSP